MRDVLLTLIFAGLVPFALARPYIGACLWAWISIMNPHTLTYGFARGLPWAQLAAGVTLFALVFNGRRRYALPWSAGTAFLLALMVWVTVTSAFSINASTDVWDRWTFFMKILVMLLVSLTLIRGRQQIETLLWVIVVSVGIYGVKGGVWTLLTGGGGRVWGPPGGMMADNNSIAIGLVIVLPWMYYLRLVSKKRLVRHGLAWSMLFSVFAILGTQSRGALLALLVMGLMLGLKSKNAVRATLGIAVIAIAAIAFMPDSWSERMSTIGGYNADTSALSRLWTWQTLWNLALDRPLVGGGFRSDSVQVFSVYSPVQGRGDFDSVVYVAHSIYFQALGEHGFPGLLLFLAIGVWTWFTAGRLGRESMKRPDYEPWVPLLMRMCQVSLAGFAVGGAFLSLMVFDLSFYIFGIVLLVKASMKPTSDSSLARAARAMQPSHRA